ncbi:putative quinol monooxygenase [Vibrio hepatarius]|uniref:putative quinol monooxygenase n=1 Tax=Vibrio hepatarius TaxID=171383 RepID=UPI001C080E17|nr:antibiotic biosynthesis monooxygenase [Vibrio hepatarius]MBU2899032.1 antibiotic biosynthesis monooxygenase [Vibrio hepatarius]
MSKVVLKGFILVPESELGLVNSELIDHKRLTLEEEGCIIFQVTENSQNPLRFDVYEAFIDRAAFDYHQERVKASQWGKITTHVQRYYEVFE